MSLPVPQYPIDSVDRTLRLLSHLAQRSELKLSEVRAHLEIGQSTAHRLMAMLVYRGFAVQDPETRAYRVGPALFEIAEAAGAFDIRRNVHPILEWLANESGETAHFGVLHVTDVHYIDVVESTSVLRVAGRVGQINPAHATSLGKAILATFDDGHVRELYADSEISVPTTRSTTNLSRLLKELGSTRTRGWARNQGEIEAGVCSVGVAAEHPVRGVLGAFSLASPQVRYSRAMEKAHASLLRNAAKRLLSTVS